MLRNLRFNFSKGPRKVGLVSKVLAVLLGFGCVSLVHAQNFPHIRTFGFDYVSFNNDLTQAEWAARQHDWVVGISPSARSAPAYNPVPMRASVYNAMKTANPDVKIVGYYAFHSIDPQDMTWMEQWCLNNNLDPESLYYHYYYDTQIRVGSGNFITVPGYGGGSATSLAQARAKVRWNGGWVAINPSSSTWRAASQAIVREIIRVETGATGQFVDGLFLDSFDGLSDTGYFSSHLENTIELRQIGTVDQVYTKVRQDLVDAKVALESYLKSQTGNSSFVVMVNVGDIDYPYQWYASSYMGIHRAQLNELAVEYLITAGFDATDRIIRLRQTYDDLVSGRRMWLRSESNNYPFRFTQFILATHYLINHPNAAFMFHQGGAANYGGISGNIRTTHWHPNMEINIGQPVVRSSADFWNSSNTDRFFVFSQTSSYTILGREFSNGLVLAKFARAGAANIGTNPTTHQLSGTYYPLLENNAYGAAVTTVTLGEAEGVILVKSTSASGPGGDTTSSSDDASASGGSGCGFVKDDNNGKGQGAKGEGVALMIMLIMTLLALVRKAIVYKGSKGAEHIKKMTYLSLFFFFFVIFCTPVLANAADYYVAPNGSDSNPGTITQPWQHIAWATCGGSYLCPITTNNPNKLKAGDTLYIRGGTYTENLIKFANSGTSGNPITIKGYPGEVAVVDAGFTAPDGLTTRAVFDIDGKHYITLDSLTIMRGQKANVRIGYNLSTTNITVRNCDIMNVNAYDNSGEIYVHPLTDNILIENNKLHGRGSLSNNIEGNGIQIFYAGNLIIRNNEIYNSGGNPATDWTYMGIQYKGSVDNGATTIIENNLIYNQLNRGMNINKRGAIIRNNVIYNIGKWGIRVFEESSSCDKLVSSYNQILKNTIVDVGAGIWLDRSTSCPGAINTLIKDNIIYNFNATDHRGLSVWPWWTGSDTSNTTFDHNLIYSSSLPSPIRVLSNYYTTATAPLSGTGNIQQAPTFTDYANKNFTLQPNSPGYKAASDGYDMGADTSLPPTPTPDGGGGGSNTPPPSSSSGGDSGGGSGGSGCGFVRDSNGKGQGAKGEGLSFAIMLIITLTGISLARRTKSINATKEGVLVMNIREISLIKIAAISFLLTIFWSASAYAQPNITSFSGSLTNKGALTITGSGFGTKNPAAPLKWDDFENGTTGNDLGNGWFLSSSNGINPKYANDQIRPNSTLSSKQVFTPTGQYNCTMGLTGLSNSRYYVTFYRYMAPSGGGSRNWKIFVLRGGPPGNWDNPEWTHALLPSVDSGLFYNYDGFTVWEGEDYLTNSWNRYEYYIDNPGGGADSYYYWIDGILKSSRTNAKFYSDASSAKWPNLYIDSYFATDTYNAGAEMWHDDVYIDTTQARVEIGNAPTWAASIHREIQIPSAWSDTSITITLNQGSFANFNNAYLYVIDANGNVNANGYLLSDGGGNTTPPPSSDGSRSGDSSASGGSGCGFVRDSNGKGQGAKGEGVALMIMLIITLTIVYLIRRSKVIRRVYDDTINKV